MREVVHLQVSTGVIILVVIVVYIDGFAIGKRIDVCFTSGYEIQ